MQCCFFILPGRAAYYLCSLAVAIRNVKQEAKVDIKKLASGQVEVA